MPETGSDSLRVVFMGTPALTLPILDAVAGEHHVVLAVTQPDRPRGRGRRPRESPVKAWAREREVPVYQPEGLGSAADRQPIVDADPDVVLVVAYGLILPPPLLSLPPHGCVNVHASLLPRHRGASPIQAAILAGDRVTGVTTMLMDEGLDTGPILLQQEVAVRADDTAGSLGERLAAAGAELAVETLAGLAAAAIEPRPQDPAAVTVTRLIAKEDGRIDWSEPAGRIERKVRAYQPWPSAWTRFEDTRIKIWRAEELRGAELEPGTVLAARDSLDVACGRGTALRVLELQQAGGRRLAAPDFLRGTPIPPGTRLDPPADA